MTLHFAVFPFDVVTVMTAFPIFFAVTLPLTTVATDVSDDDHNTVLSFASQGYTVAVYAAVSPALRYKLPCERVML